MSQTSAAPPTSGASGTYAPPAPPEAGRPDVLCVFGTRPEAVKLAPVVEALRAEGARVAVCATGQHTNLLDTALLARLRPDVGLGVETGGSLLRFLTAVRPKVDALLALARPRVVLVQGDTASAFAGALGAHGAGVPLAHVEAGVRSGDLRDPWPEELIRVAIDRLATWRYAPTAHTAQVLRADGLDSVVTGNTGIDALCAWGGVAPRTEAKPPTVLVTLHRREFYQRVDAGAVLQALADAVAVAHIEAVWPVHPAMTALASGVRFPPNFTPRPPFAWHTMLAVLAQARGVLTDSGGVTEEAAWLGVPTAILRFHHDRPEAVDAGIARAFPPTPAGVQAALHTLATCGIARRPSPVYGDGAAATRIARHLMHELATRSVP